MSKRAGKKRGGTSTWFPRDLDEAKAEFEKARLRSPDEIAALERCWTVALQISPTFFAAVKRYHEVDRRDHKLEKLGAKLTPAQRAEMLLEPDVDGAGVAAQLLGPTALMTAREVMADFIDQLLLLLVYFDRRGQDPGTVVPYLYAWCGVLLGIGSLKLREFALGEVLFGGGEIPKTSLLWEQAIKRWQKKVLGTTTKSEGTALTVADTVRTLRREWAAKQAIRP